MLFGFRVSLSACETFPDGLYDHLLKDFLKIAYFKKKKRVEI